MAPPPPRRRLLDFDARFRQGAIPDDMPEVSLLAGRRSASEHRAGPQAVGTDGEHVRGLRMIEQGGVRIDGIRN
jgi:tyrosyl-tRNA synthetase